MLCITPCSLGACSTSAIDLPGDLPVAPRSEASDGHSSARHIHISSHFFFYCFSYPPFQFIVTPAKVQKVTHELLPVRRKPFMKGNYLFN